MAAACLIAFRDGAGTEDDDVGAAIVAEAMLAVTAIARGLSSKSKNRSRG